MKMLVAGVKVLSGFSKKSNSDFEIPLLFGLVAVENFKKEHLASAGYGFEPMEVRIDPFCLPQFIPYAGKFPCHLDLDTDVMPFMGEVKTVVIGIRVAPAVVKAA